MRDHKDDSLCDKADREELKYEAPLLGGFFVLL